MSTPAPGPAPINAPTKAGTPERQLKNKDRKNMCEEVTKQAGEIAKEITRMREIGDILNTAVCTGIGWLNPQCYKAEAKNLAVQFNNQYSSIDASNNDVINVQSNCANVTNSSQFNNISTLECPYCQQYGGCDIKNNKQTNVLEAVSQCEASNALKLLFDKKLDFESIAKAKAIQDSQAKGPMTEAVNDVINAVCNQNDIDMSSNQFIDTLSNCKNEFSNIQKNNLQGCGKILGNVQENAANSFMRCVANNTSDITVKEDIKAKISSSVESEQKATADMAAFSASSSAICCICCICIGVLALFMFMPKGARKKMAKELSQNMS